MIDVQATRLWNSKYNPQKIGFHPLVESVRIVIEYPCGTWRKLTRIVPYPLPDGGFGVMVPYHKAGKGLLFKARVHDTIAGLVRLPPPARISRYIASNSVKLSFHSDGATQFSTMDHKNKIISGRDPVTGEFKGLGIMSRPFTNPVWSGPTFSIVAWGLSQFEVCKPGSEDIIFTAAEMINPYLRSAKQDAICLEAYILSRAKPTASTTDFPGYRAIMRYYNSKLAVFGSREIRLIALHNEEALVGVHVAKFPNIFRSRSGYRIASPRDENDNGIYAHYPPDERGDFSCLDYGVHPQTQSGLQKPDESSLIELPRTREYP